MISHAQRTAAIRSLNDRLRTTLEGGHLVMSAGVHDKAPGFAEQALAAIRRFNRFNPGNDLRGEHDFGTLTLMGERLIWKIDYYNLTLDGGSPDPADPELTHRVLTVLLSHEW